MPSAARISRSSASIVRRLRFLFVIVANEMQEAVDDEMRDMRAEASLLGVGFARACLVGDGDIAERLPLRDRRPAPGRRAHSSADPCRAIAH